MALKHDKDVFTHRLLAKVRGDMASSRGKSSSEEKWIEVVVDLWGTHLKHVRERATRYQRPSDFLFDPTTMKFGFQQGFGTGDSDSEAESESESDEEPLWRRKKHAVPITEGSSLYMKRKGDNCIHVAVSIVLFCIAQIYQQAV